MKMGRRRRRSWLTSKHASDLVHAHTQARWPQRERKGKARDEPNEMARPALAFAVKCNADELQWH